MNSRERVLAALDFREPDRVPVDVWGSASRICDQLYYEIVNREGWSDLGPYVAASRSGNYVDPRVSDLIGSDIRHTNVGKPKNFKAYKDENGYDVNEWGIPMKKVSGESIIALHPLKDAAVADIDKHAWPTPADPGRIVGVKEQVEHWRSNTDYFVATTSVVSGLMIDIGPYLRSFEQFFMDLYINKEFAHKLIGRITDLLIEYYRYFLEPIGPLVDWVEFSSDHGMQDRPLIAVETYREFFKEPYKRLFREVKKAAPNAKIWMHSCGAVRDLIPEFIDVGVDILNSLQPRATGMDSLELKKEFGREIVFHGGLDIQGGVNGTVQEAIDETRRRLDAFMPGGGYIFAPSNHYMEDVPIDNFYAIHETVREYGVY
jgi:uroporphyrinogen decarboxylase